MTTAFAPISLAPTIGHSRVMSPPRDSNGYASYSNQSISLDTPQISSSSTETFASHHAGYPRPGNAGSREQSVTSQNSYLPTPDSARPLQQFPSSTQYSSQQYSQQQQQQQQHYSSSSQPDWHPQVAGPSKHRRHSPSGMASPTSIADYFEGTMNMGSQGPSPAKGHEVTKDASRTSRIARDDDEGDGRAGVEDPYEERKYTELKCLGDGSFGTVWLCDWHSPVKPDVLLSAMQCGAGARPEWAGKRLVALKRMKRVWEGGWKQAKTLGELVSLRKIPPHPAIIPLYDAFISPRSRELYFVFECMEGNLYQLTKSRRGRPLAAGLIASCFHQISAGLYHIHRNGYFHRDMKPENLLVTTTGLTDYLTAAALAQINSSRGHPSGHDSSLQHPPTSELASYEKDVAVIVKLADFGLARATDSKPPYTEYVSTRWYRAPEVLLRSTEYGAPVDMWALGTILAEMLNLKPLFPGVSEIDQVYRICDTMGDPTDDYGLDERGRPIGGGSWNSGIKLAKNVGFSFPKRKPVRFRGLFSDSVPQSLVDCIADLLRYNPKYRMTAAQCIDHAYFHETLPHLQRTPPLPRIPFGQGQPAPAPQRPPQPEMNVPPRQIPPSHSHTPQEGRPAFANGEMRTLPPPVGTPDGGSPNPSHRLFLSSQPHLVGHPVGDRMYGASALVNQLRELDLPTDDLSSYGNRPPPSPGNPQQSYIDDRQVAMGHTQQWINDAASAARAPSVTQSTLYDGSVFEGSQSHLSNPSFTNFSTASVNEAPRQPQMFSQPAPHVAAYVQQQQRYVEETPRLTSVSQISMAPPIEPTVGAARADKLGVTGKKKKWGLSSVFGGADKSTTHLDTVDEHGYTGSSSLKRTQSGHNPQDRLPPVTIDDPKKAKKEAERQAKELEKAKREAMAQKQRERARAVMQKRNQLVEARTQTNTRSDIEFSSSAIHGLTGPPAEPSSRQPPVYASASNMLLAGHAATGSAQDLRAYPDGQASRSVSSIRSHDSGHSHHSARSGLSAAALAAYDNGHSEGRHKARRRDDDDDHSMSSFGHNSLRSRSVLTVGTVDSDPGPRRVRHDWNDPILRHHDSKRAPSVSSLHHQHSLMSRSNTSLESQLAHDFRMHANVGSSGGAGSSALSLGRAAHGSSASQLALHTQLESIPSHGMSGLPNGSAPTSPYGHPKAVAVAHGVGMGRLAGGSGTMLPSISSWEGNGVGVGHDQGQGHINPMFRVPPADGRVQQQQPQPQQGTTLPPFSAIASVAGREGHQQNR